MGRLQSIGKRVALQLAALVARNELFERYGDRPVQPPLRPDDWSHDDGASSTADDGPVEQAIVAGSSQLLGATAIKRKLAEGPMVVNHWATWCESCETEKEALKELDRRSGVPLVGISWDMFEGGTPDDALAAVKAMCSDVGITWNQWVVKGKPPHFFKVLDVTSKQVPQTWIIDAQGQVVETIEGPIDSDKVKAILSRVESL